MKAQSSRNGIGVRDFASWVYDLSFGAFVGKPIDQFSNDERIAYYRQIGLEAMDHARKANSDEVRAAWLNIAASWAALADEVERQAQREAGIATMQSD